MATLHDKQSDEAREFMAEVGGWAIAIPVAMPILVGLVLWRGHVLTILWGWFIVPLGVMPLTVSHAIGVCVVLTFLRGHTQQKVEHPWKAIVGSWILPAVSLGTGYVARWYMV